MTNKEKAPSAHQVFRDEIVRQVYWPKLKAILDGPNPPATVGKLAEAFRERYHVGTGPAAIAEWLDLLGVQPATQVAWDVPNSAKDTPVAEVLI